METPGRYCINDKYLDEGSFMKLIIEFDEGSFRNPELCIKSITAYAKFIFGDVTVEVIE